MGPKFPRSVKEPSEDTKQRAIDVFYDFVLRLKSLLYASGPCLNAQSHK